MFVCVCVDTVSNEPKEDTHESHHAEIPLDNVVCKKLWHTQFLLKETMEKKDQLAVV